MKRKRTTSAGSKASRRIAFACDVLRMEMVGEECTNFQHRNMVWLRELLTPGLSAADPAIELFDVAGPASSTALAELMGGPSTVGEYHEDPEMAWARRYDLSDASVVDWYVDQLCESDLVVGFELPPIIKRSLHARGQRYLNLCIHPLRFLRDLCFGATTNDPSILAAVRTSGIDPSEVLRQVHRYRALFRRRQVEAYAIPHGLPVLIGQTAKDSVLIRQQRFSGWHDYGDELKRLLEPYDALIFLEHPMRANSSLVTEGLRSMLGKTVISTNANSYGVLLSNPGIAKVLTLSSSLGVEAQAFGIDTQFLLADPRDKFVVDGCDLTDSVPCGHGMLGCSFWSAVLMTESVDQLHGERRMEDFSLGEHYVRNSLDAWSFRAIQFGLDVAPARKSLIPAEQLSPARRDSLLGELLSYSRLPVTPATALQRARATGLQLEFLDPPLEIGEQRSIALGGPSATTYFASGFHSPEAWGSWSGALESSMAFPVARAAVATGSRLNVKIKLRIYDGLLQSTPVLRLSHGGDVLGFVFFRPGLPLAQEVEVQLPVQSSLVLLNFEMTGLQSPAARGESGDSRWLGFAVHDLDVKCERSPQAQPEGRAHATLGVWGIARDAISDTPDRPYS